MWLVVGYCFVQAPGTWALVSELSAQLPSEQVNSACFPSSLPLPPASGSRSDSHPPLLAGTIESLGGSGREGLRCAGFPSRLAGDRMRWPSSSNHGHGAQ